jgi:DNA polymerase-3 subunit delta'
MDKSPKSQIIITPNATEALELVLKENENPYHKIFEAEEFKVEDAKNVIAEAYIAEERYKFIFIISKNINLIAQNSLLKILEEPPKNIVFIIIIPSKSSLLPTILSRLSIRYIKTKKIREKLEIDLAHLSVAEIYDFLKDKSHISKSEAKEIMESILIEAHVKEGLIFEEQKYRLFDRLYHLLNLNSRPSYILLTLLLEILELKRRENGLIQAKLKR